MAFLKTAIVGPDDVETTDEQKNAFLNDPNYKTDKALLNTQINGINSAKPSQFLGGQTGLVSTLQNQIAGRGPSVAQQQLQAGNEQNINSIMAAANSARGHVNTGLLARQTANGIQAANAQTNQQAAILRAGEQQQAQSQLGSVLASARGQDIQDQQAKNELTQRYVAMGLSLDQAQAQAAQDWAKLQLGVQQGNVAQQVASANGLLGGLASVGAAAATGGASKAAGK